MRRKALRAAPALTALTALALLAACASTAPYPTYPPAGQAALRPAAQVGGESRGREELADPRSAGPEVYADLIRGMISQQQYYAALAHIQEQQARSGDSEELRYLEAETRRQLGQAAAAEQLYRRLLRGAFAARAYRGLGLLSVERDLSAALGLLAEAVKRAPTDVDARNDYGYALMLARRYREALPEIATAVELDPGSVKARNNLLVLLMLSRDEPGVKRVAEAGDVSPQTLAQLRRQAQTLSGHVLSRGGAK
jgi:tetratricopeptide (TPR) repeat protein